MMGRLVSGEEKMAAPVREEPRQLTAVSGVMLRSARRLGGTDGHSRTAGRALTLGNEPQTF